MKTGFLRLLGVILISVLPMQAVHADVAPSGGAVAVLSLVALIALGIFLALGGLCTINNGSIGSYVFLILGIVSIIVAIIIIVPSSKNRKKQNEINASEVTQLNNLIASKISEIDHYHNLVSQCGFR